jgi:hypothetical protein
MSAPLVSVLMPVYNGARYLPAAVDSILGQSLRDLEFVVIDDGSTDETPAILSRYADRRLKLRRLEHVGLVAALNAGVDACSAPYIARMDADDLSYPDRLRRQADHLQSDPRCDLVTCYSDLLDHHGRVVGCTQGGVAPDMILELAGGNEIVHGSVMIRRSSLPSPAYPRPPEDYWLWEHMARVGRVFHCIPEPPMYGFREHGDRYSLVKAESQSRGVVEVQWPLLEECSATRDLADQHVRGRLLVGWGRVGGAAYRSGQPDRGHNAFRRFMELARTVSNGPLVAPLLTGAESLIWGGCPFAERIALRLLELRLRPLAGSSYRKLLLAMPGVEPVRRFLYRSRC